MSTGKKAAADPLKLDKGSYKGQLHYVAEFIPALAVRGIGFETGGNQLQQAAENAAGESDGDDVKDGNSMSSSDEEAQAIPQGVTVSKPMGDSPTVAKGPSHTRGAKSTDTTKTNGTVSTTAKSEENRPVERGVELSKEQLLTYRALYDYQSYIS